VSGLKFKLGHYPTATARWRTAAAAVGASKAEIDRMQSAFEHDDLKKALAF
jgi:serine/threonine-protein kinase HipA